MASAVQKLRERSSEDPMFFGQCVMPAMFAVKSADFHHELCRDYMDLSITGENIIAPRGHAKSSLVGALFVLHHVFAERRIPGPKVVVLVSKTRDHAIRLLGTISDVLQYSKNFRMMYGYHGKANAQVWTKDYIILDTGDAFICRGTGQQVVGLKVGNQRPTFIVLDDPEDLMNTKTPEAMEFNLKWLLTQLFPTRDPRKGRCFVIGTPQHQSSMVMKLGEASGWKTRHYKSITGEGPLTLENRANLKVLWPEWQPLESLLKEKETCESLGKVSYWYREFQCEIIGDETQLFTEDDIQTWDGEFVMNQDHEGFLVVTELAGVEYDEPKLIPVNIFTGIDPASSTRHTADYSAIVNTGVDAQDNRFIVSIFNKRVAPMDLATTIQQNFRTYRAVRTQIETVGYQEMLRDYLRRQDEYIPGLEIKNNPRQSKSVRLETLQPWFKAKKVYIKKGLQPLIDQLLIYPRGAHEDLLDGTYYSFKGVYRPSHDEGDAPQNRKKAVSRSSFRERWKKSWATV